MNVNENDLSSFTEIGHNIWPTFATAGKPGVFSIGGHEKTTAEWTAIPLVKSDRCIDVAMMPTGVPAGSAAVDLVGQGEPCKSVHLDRNGKPRPADHTTIGALELPGNK